MLQPRKDEMANNWGLLSTIDISQIPSSPPPPGEISNFDNPESEGPIGRVIIYLTWPLMMLFFCLRMYTRSRITRSLGADDFLSLAAAVCITVESFITLFLLDNPLGPDPWNVRLVSITTRVGNLLLALLGLYPVSSLFLKSSLLTFYLRIFRPKRGPRVIIWASLGLILIFYLILTIYPLATCHQWGEGLPSSGAVVDIPELLPILNDTQIVEEGSLEEVINLISQKITEAFSGSCSPSAQLDISVAAEIFGVVTDIYVLLLSIGLIVRLRLPVKRKVGVCAIFLIGVIACVCSAISAYFRILSLYSNDVIRLPALALPLAAAEVNVGIICSCMPVLPVLYKRITSSSAWVSFLKLIPTIRRQNAESNLGTSRETSLSSQISKRDWVKIPTATLTGLRSFIWKSNRTQHSQATELSTWAEIGSVNDEYHTHIRGGDSGRVSATKDRSIGFHA